MKQSLSAVLLCAVCVGSPLQVVSAAEDGQPITLRYKMGEKDRLIFRTTTKNKQAQTFNEAKIVTETTQTDVALRTLNQVDEKGDFELTSENKLLHVNVDVGPLGKYEFDSKSLTNEKGSALGTALTPLYEALRGAYVTVTHSPRGEIVAVKGLQELLAQALKDNPLAAQFAAGNTDEGLKLAMAELFVVFSENAVKPGETWDVEYEVPLPKIGTVKGKKTYKYVGPDKVGERATVKLEVTQSLSVDIDITMGEAKVTGNVSTSQSSGTVQFDPEAGQIVAKKTSHSFSGNLTVVAGGKTIPVQSEQTQEVTVELLDKLPE